MTTEPEPKSTPETSGGSSEPKTPQETMGDRLERERKKFEQQREADRLEYQKQIDAIKSEAEAKERKLKELVGVDADSGEDAEAKLQTKLQQANQNLKLSAFRMAAAGKLHDPDAAFKLIDPAKLQVNDKTGEVPGVDQVVEKLIKDNHWVAKGAEKPGVGTPSNPPESGNVDLDSIDMSDPKEVRKNKDSIIKRSLGRLKGQ